MTALIIEELLGDLAADWAYSTLGDICLKSGGNIQTGPFGSQLHASDYVPYGIPSIMPQNIGDNRVIEDGIARVSMADAERLERYRVRVGDIVYSRRGDVEKRALIREHEDGWLCGTGCLRVRFGETEPDSRFMSYYLGHPAVREWITRHAQGATMLNLNTSILSALPVALPPPDEQRAIAHSLGTLDDKIELNRRMNETLEEMARALFKSWFVDFDPVRAKAEGRQPAGMDAATAALFPDSFEESELGPIPAGWTVEPLENVCKRITDGAHASPKSVAQGYPMASVKDMHDWGFSLGSCRQISERDYWELVRNDCRPLAGDVLIAKDGSYLKHVFVVQRDLDLVILSSIAILRANEKMDPHLLSFYLRDETVMTRMEGYVSGAVLQRIVLKDFRQFPILVPALQIQREWSRVVTPLITQCWLNVYETELLSATRDSLLPKLLSGEILIKEATRFLGEALASKPGLVRA